MKRPEKKIAPLGIKKKEKSTGGSMNIKVVGTNNFSNDSIGQ